MSNPNDLTTKTIDLARACMELRGSSPERWDEFIAILEKYDMYMSLAIKEAPASELVTAQGVARGVSMITGVFMNCRELAQPKPAPNRPTSNPGMR